MFSYLIIVIDIHPLHVHIFSCKFNQQCCNHHHHHHWRNSPIWAQAFLRSFRQPSLFIAAFLQFFSPNFLASSITPSSHLSFGLPLCLFPSTTAARTLLAGLCSSNRITCPAHLRRLTFIYVTILLSLYKDTLYTSVIFQGQFIDSVRL